MKTTLNIPDDLINTAMTVSRIRTKTETVVTALKEYIRMKKLENILAQEGKLEFDDHWENSRHAR